MHGLTESEELDCWRDMARHWQRETERVKQELHLSDEDREALIHIRNQLRNSERRSPDIMHYPIENVRAREALDRLLSRGKDGR